MPRYGYPADNYTPHGYLANPHAVAHSWSDGEGGCLRSSRRRLGVGWQLPWALQAKASADLVIALECDGERLVTRADFVRADLTSPHHTSQLLTYRWQAFGCDWDASFVLVAADQLGVQIVWSPLPFTVAEQPPRTIRLTVGVVGWQQPATGTALQAVVAQVDLGEPFGTFHLRTGAALVSDTGGSMVRIQPTEVAPDATLTDTVEQAAVSATFELPASGEGTLAAVLQRVTDGATPDSGEPVAARVGRAVARARSADDAFWSKAARLVGDWPHHWRRGWVYDLETTRMCIFPAGGVFTDVWPAWMIQWPRAVVAEGTLDVARLAYADPQLALRAALSLFRDTTADNIPCIFQHGVPNMVAADGSVCGTSPAWCVPFYNLERLYLMTHDREWLAAIYPHLVLYVEWWLRERTDVEGWAVYKCTWEAGEDDTPRLDPERRGDNVVSQYVRPVELQATMALSAGVLARFARALGKSDDESRWQQVEGDFAALTRMLWDAAEGRFRDWDARANAFLAPAATGEPDKTNYWGIDPCRFSALAFTPALAATNDWTALSDDQVCGLQQELRHYDGPPWTLWASWSYVVLEAAGRLGEGAWAAQIAAGIVDRVYRELDAREIAAPNHPTPGVAREFWPLDLDTWASSEGYGWGANTASLLMRQVVGFIEESPESGEYLDPGAPGWRVGWLRFTLAPNLPDEFLIPGTVYQVANLSYRGAQISVGYRVNTAATATEPARLTLMLSADVPTECAVTPMVSDGPLDTETRPPAARHTVSGRNSERYLVMLRPAAGS